MPRMTSTPGIRPGCRIDRHDTVSAYRYGCRCPAAREQHRIYGKRHAQNRLNPASVDATGTRRRIQALQAIGWRLADIGNHLDVTWQNIAAIKTADRVYRTTADRIAAAYDQLCMTVGPSTEARRRALDKGYAPPLAWDDIDDPAADPTHQRPPDDSVDEVLVARVLAGHTPAAQLNDAERAAAAAHGLAAGMTVSTLADLLGARTTTITKLAATAA